MEVWGTFRACGKSKTFFTLITRNKPFTVAEGVDGKMAVVGTALAHRRFCRVLKAIECLSANNCGFGQLHRTKSRSVSTHKSGNRGADNILSKLHFKGAEHGVVIERTALYNYMLAKLVGRGRSYYLVYCILYNAYGKTCRNILDSSTISLRLLYGGIHKYRTSASEINGGRAEKTLVRKILYGVSH